MLYIAIPTAPSFQETKIALKIMNRQKIGRILLSVLSVFTTSVSIGVDWNDSHVFNAHWPPHAVFHDVMLLVLLAGITVISLWLLWRRSTEPGVAVRTVSALQIIFWGSFYIAVWLPNASPSAEPGMSPPTLIGVPLYPNMVVALVVIVLAALADWLYHNGASKSSG